MTGSCELKIQLPYPHGVSVNHCYARSKSGVYLTPKAVSYKKCVYILTRGELQFADSAIRVEIKIYPPDKRKRDIDNICKIVIDSFMFSKIFNDDSQIKQLYLEKLDVIKDGKLDITIKKIIQ